MVQLNHSSVSEYFKYSEDSPSKLVRIRDVYSCQGRIKVASKGDIAGCMGRTHYVVGFQGRNVECHRLIWILFHGDIPEGMVIDHINGDSFDNSISNLRCVTKSLNQRNRKKPRNNTSGLQRLSTTVLRGDLYWRVAWIDPGTGRQRTKNFNTRLLGESCARMSAEEFLQEISEKLEFSGYTKRHGK